MFLELILEVWIYRLRLIRKRGDYYFGLKFLGKFKVNRVNLKYKKFFLRCKNSVMFFCSYLFVLNKLELIWIIFGLS